MNLEKAVTDYLDDDNCSMAAKWDIYITIDFSRLSLLNAGWYDTHVEDVDYEDLRTVIWDYSCELELKSHTDE